MAEEPVTLTIRLPEGERVAEKASKFHGIRNDDCAGGAMFEEVARRLGEVLEKPRARDICHNLFTKCLSFVVRNIREAWVFQVLRQLLLLASAQVK